MRRMIGRWIILLGLLGALWCPAVLAVDFMNDVKPLLSRLGCNGSSCHGKAEGQNGFKLSVFGADPRGDYHSILKEARGRRITQAAPEASLFLRKATGEVGHGGGVRLQKGSREYRVLHNWIRGGLTFAEEERPAMVALRMEPARAVLPFGAKQPLKVIARYADGQEADVTWQAVFHSNDVGMAKVDEQGLVTLGRSIGQTAVMARFQGKVSVFQAIVPRPGPKPTLPARPVHNFIDRHVDRHLTRLNVHPSDLTDDATFLRRAHLDLIGTLPTAAETEAFLKDTRKDKRAQLVEALMRRTEFADFWALKWSDLLRVDRLALGHENAFAYYQWIRAAMRDNRPLDQWTRELLTAEGPLRDQPAGFFYKVAAKPGEMAAMTSQVFLGVRITCAECHQHPYDQWTQQDYQGMRGFFAQVKYKKLGETEALLAEGDPKGKHPRTGAPVFPYALGTAMPEAAPEGDRRQALADWMTQPNNPWFARNLANRIWAHFMGRGLIEPVDDLRATNPASNPELMTALTQTLVENQYDLRAMIRLITASRTYQLSSEPNATNELDERNYSRALLRRLPAEVLLDAVSQVTGIEEKFHGVAPGARAIQLWDSQVQHYFLKLFGRPARASVCDCERAVGASMAQALHLMNSPELEAKLAHAGGHLGKLEQRHADDAALARQLYLTIYNREPTAAERDRATQHLGSRRAHRRKAAEDLAWAMLNSMEFIFNH